MINMKKISALFVLVAILVAPTSARATSIGFGAVPSARNVVNSAGVTLPAGDLVWAGAFAVPTGFTFNPNISISANVSNIESLGGWHQFGLDTSTGLPNAGLSSTLSTIATGGLGRIGGSVNDNVFGATKADFFNGKDLYVWAFNGTTVSNSTEMGIFHASVTVAPWIFPTNAGGIGDNITFSTTTTNAAVIDAIGGAGSTPSGQLKLSGLVTAPEPSSFLLVALAIVCGGLFYCFRRKPAGVSELSA